MNTLKTILMTISVCTLTLWAADAKTNKIEFELDPLAYGLGGASGHVAYTWKNERIQLGFGMLDIPEGMQDNEAVSESFKAISLKWDYFIGRPDPSKGFFVGLASDYLFLNYKDESGDSEDRQRVTASLRTGYKFDILPKHPVFKGLYITPWASVSYLFNNKKVKLSGTTYSLKSIKLFPTVHIGWAF